MPIISMLPTSGIPDQVIEQNKGAKQKFWVGTKSELDAIVERDANTLYIVTDDEGSVGGGDELKAHLEDKNNPHGVTAEQVGAALKEHTHTAGEVGARPNTWTPNLKAVADLGENPVKSTADDTTDQWCRIGSGYAWYSTNGLLNDQPAQYGFLLNYVCGSDVFQIWNSQDAGPLYTRSGNVNGWGRSWKKLIDSASIGSQTVNKAKYASITAPGTASLKNIKAGTSDLTAGSSSLTTGDIYLVYE